MKLLYLIFLIITSTIWGISIMYNKYVKKDNFSFVTVTIISFIGIIYLCFVIHTLL